MQKRKIKELWFDGTVRRTITPIYFIMTSVIITVWLFIDKLYIIAIFYALIFAIVQLTPEET